MSTVLTGVEHLRFLKSDILAAFLSDAGFEMEAQFGDWDRTPLSRSSREIITLVRRPLGAAFRGTVKPGKR